MNKCIRQGIALRDLRWKDSLELTAKLQRDDYDRLKKAAGHSYRLTILEERGATPAFRRLKANIWTILGAFLLGALLFYQSQFVAEIRVDGYERLTETAIRQTLEEAGLYEGAKKENSYDHVKAALYESHPQITWVSIYPEGRLVKVHIAEAGEMDGGKAAAEKPVHIVAARSGMIEKILPLEGNAKVQKGDYVNKGDVLISGKYKYQSTDYSRGDDFYIMYSHAEGHAYAKVPRRIDFYLEKNVRQKQETGKCIPGFFIRAGHMEIDTAQAFCRYEASVREEIVLMDTVVPLPISLGFVRIREVELVETRQDQKKLERVLAAAVRQYQKDEMKDGEEILKQAIDYSESENLIRASVFLEVLEDIGEEREIKIPKKDKNKNEADEKIDVQ